MKKRGLLLTLTEPPPGMEERWVADVPPGEGKYLATYELDSADVLTSPQYLSFFQKPTPWTRRCLGKAVVFKRWACEQIEPGTADPHPAAKALLVNSAVPRALQVRRFAVTSGEDILLCELSDYAVQTSPGLVYRLYVP